MKRQLKGLVVNEWFMGRPEIIYVIEKYGAAGLGKLVAVCVKLMGCDNAIGTEEDLDYVSGRIKSRIFKMREMIHDSRLFSIVESSAGTLFSIKFLRDMLGLEEEISEEESEYIVNNGNKTRKLRTTVYGRKVPSRKSDGLQSVCKQSASGSQSVRNSSANKLDVCKVSDNEAVDSAPICNMNDDNDIVHDITECNDNVHEHMSTSVSRQPSVSDDDDAEGSFKFFEEKILEAAQWRKSVSVSLGINLEDDAVARIFAKWMFNYCITKNKTKRSAAEILDYAANLLLVKHSTRSAFEKYLAQEKGSETPPKGKKQHEERAVYAVEPRVRACYEQFVNGTRVGMEGQILPSHAPRQYNIDERWSYIQDRYVHKSVWDRMAEEAARLEFERKENERKEAERVALVKECRSMREHGGDGICSVGEIIEGAILPNMNHKDKGASEGCRNE